ncbi:MAG: ABC transporter ATP-binding protein [Rhodospirillales bacterium]|nr:ABC transporter ATP-binding protein [Rhodospirillales bacterium]
MSIELSRVSTAYGGVPMLREVDLRVAEGEIVCVLGPNGAGKSTLFKVFAGLIAPVSGTVRIMNADVSKTGTEQIPGLGVGFVPEGRRLFPSLTVAENIRLGYDAVRPGGTGLGERLAAIGRIFPRVSERLHQLAGTLSGGEQSMVALARALIGRPRLVVMDEPSLGLSPKLIREYFDVLRLIHGEGTTVLLIEQNAEMALRVAARGYVLARGRIVAADRSEALRSSRVVRNLYFN